MDNSPASYAFQPAHAVETPSWFDDRGIAGPCIVRLMFVADTLLRDVRPTLQRLARGALLPGQL
jgi:TFIIF-interacting CTD phosphatase-like protein